MEGQLWPQERAMLHQTILTLKPELALEIGTWKGGGSTYQIADALVKNGKGLLITCEPDPELFAIAKNTYEVELAGKMPVQLVNDYSHNLINHLVNHGRIPDFVLMDGPEDPNVCLNDLKALENLMKPGSIVAFHDWDLGVRADGLVSTKSEFVRPYIEGSKEKWVSIGVLTAPVSVGFSVWRRL